MSKSAYATAVTVAFVAMLAVALVPLGTGSDPVLTRAGSSTYEYDVLPGLQPGYEGPLAARNAAQRYFTATNLVMTCGWHGVCTTPATAGYAIDSVITSSADTKGKTVWAALRAGSGENSTDDDFTAEVSFINGGSDLKEPARCKRIEVDILNADMKTVATVLYTHTIATLGLGEDNVELPEEAGEIAMTPVGKVAYKPGTNGGVDEDNPNCEHGDPHLHLEGADLERLATPLWSNRDYSASNPASPATGFPVGNVGARTYCSDTWVFKIRPTAPSPRATAIAPCPPTPATPVLSATGRDSRIDLSWTNPNTNRADAITGYQIRVRTAGADWGEWQSVGGGATTAHTLDDLENGTLYTIGLRAVSARLLRSSASTASATPMAPPTPPPTPPQPPPEPTCPTGEELVNGVCVCEEGKERVNGVCVDKCGTGEERVNGACVCEEGKERVNGVCVDKCGTGEERVNGACVCEEGKERVNGACVDKCGTGEERVNGACVCEEGKERVNGACVDKCGTGEERVNGACVCEEGKERVNGVCVPESTPTPPPTPTPRPTYSLSTSVSVCCGSISVSPPPPYYRDSNTPVTLTARPRGLVFSFDSWGGACAGETSATCNLTMDGNKSVTVSFSHSCDGNTGIGCRRQEGDGGNGEEPPP